MSSPTKGERYRIKRVLTQFSLQREISKEKVKFFNFVLLLLIISSFDYFRNDRSIKLLTIWKIEI